MGTVILLASIIIWAAGYFPRSHQTSADPETAAVIQVENSYIGQFGHFISPVLEPLGYNWKTGISILTGMAAKEIIVSSMGVLYNGTSHIKETLTPLTAYSLMLFILLYFPCIATLAAIQKEAGTKWALFSAFYTTLVAWIISFAIYQIGGLFL
jgi:ferrous iron transport protein B